MDLKTCDFCGEFLVKEIINVGVLCEEVNNTSKIANVQDYLNYIQKQQDKLERYEICQECYNVWSLLKSLRLRKLKRLQNKFQELKLKEPKNIGIIRSSKKIKQIREIILKALADRPHYTISEFQDEVTYKAIIKELEDKGYQIIKVENNEK